MPKSGSKSPFVALRKIFKETSAEKVPFASELQTLEKLIHRTLSKPPSSPCPSSVPMESSKKVLSCLAEKFIFQLNKASATKPEESHVPVQESCAVVMRDISSILPCSDELDSSVSHPNFAETYPNHYLGEVDQRKKETSRFRKQKNFQNSKKSIQFLKLMKLCADKLDIESTLGVFGRLGREISLNECQTLIRLWIDKARQISGENSLDYIQKVYHFFISMKDRGFQILEDCYGPVLLYMIEMRMKEEFLVFTEFVKDYDRGSHNNLGYYEMLFWIKIEDECKIKELCSSIIADEYDCNNTLAESYLLALCENDRKAELIQLLEVFDMRSISSLDHASCIFKTMGRLQLENFLENFVLTFKTRGTEDENISSFICDYASSIPNLAVEDILSKFEKLHQKVEVMPTITSWDKLINLSCNLSKVPASIDIADRLCQSGLAVSIESFHPILNACARTCEFDLVHRIYPMICHYNLKPSGDTFKTLIVLYLKMKDFEGAYQLLNDAMKMKVMPITGMYNALMAGYFREKNSSGALKVLKQMLDLDIKPDSETYSYLISNCGSEKDIVKYHEQMQQTGVQASKYIYMSIINAYANFGKFKKAKQVIQDAAIPSRYLNEVKCVLISALCSNGQITEALHEYDEIKQTSDRIEPKAAIDLIEHLQSEGNLDRLRQLLDDLIESSYWFDGCSRVALYCVRHNLARPAVELLEKLKTKDESGTYIVIDQLFSDIWSMEPTNLEIGLELLRAIKEELHLCVSRISLDFLLSTCVKAKDPRHAQLVWSEYADAGLPYNMLTFLRMYQALLASGDHETASDLLKRMKKDDPHVRYVIECCKATYRTKYSHKKKNIVMFDHFL